MLERIKLTSEIINKRFDPTYPYYGLLFLSCYGLLTKYGDEYLEIIESTFKNTDFYIDTKDIKNLIDDTNLSKREKNYSKKNNDLEKCKGYCLLANNIVVDKHKNFYFVTNNPKVLCTITDCINENLNSLIHELNHIVKGTINSAQKDDCSISLRSGLMKDSVHKRNNKIYTSITNYYLEESITVLQTSDMLLEIKDLDPELLPLKVRETFSKLDLENLDKHSGYEDSVFFLILLWSIPDFKEMIEKNSVIGNIQNIEDKFNHIIGENCFEYFSSAIDRLYTTDDEDEITKSIDYIASVSELYRIKTNEISKKLFK